MLQVSPARRTPSSRRSPAPGRVSRLPPGSAAAARRLERRCSVATPSYCLYAASSQNSQPLSLVVTCCFTTPRRRQRDRSNSAVVAQLCKLCLSPLITALSARAAVVQALEELAWPSGVDTLGFDASSERCIRHSTTCLALGTTPIAVRHSCFLRLDKLLIALSSASARRRCAIICGAEGWRRTLHSVRLSRRVATSSFQRQGPAWQ